MTSRTASGTSSRSAPLRAGGSPPEPGPVGGQHLLLHAADRQHPALQRDLAGHADLGRTGRPVSRLTSAVVMVMPADGPSLGTAPAGKCTWKRRGRRPARRCRGRRRVACTYERAICADSFITSPSWPVTVSLGSPCAVHGGGLDEEHVAAGAGDGQAGGHAGHRACGRRPPRRRTAAPAEQLGDPRRRRPRSGADGAAGRPERRPVLRSSLPSSRSRLRTPASRV